MRVCILSDDLDEMSSAEYGDVENGTLRTPKLPPSAMEGVVSARITDLLFSNGTVQRNVVTMDCLRTIRARAKEPPPPPNNEMVVRNQDCYVNGEMVRRGEETQLLPAQNVNIVVAYRPDGECCACVSELLDVGQKKKKRSVRSIRKQC